MSTRRLRAGVLTLAMGAVGAGTVPGVAGPAAASATGYQVTPLVSDIPGAAAVTDPALVNAWGMSQGPTTPVWVSDNGTGPATLYAPAAANPKVNLTVKIPGGAPTGQVFNGATDAFLIGATNQPAKFVFASEAGVITAWNLDLPRRTSNSGMVTSRAVRAVTMHDGAVFKGLAIAGQGIHTKLYATDFHNARVDVFDAAFHRVNDRHAFVDATLPAGYAPFGIATIGGEVIVSYAQQDAARHDDVPGLGHGFVDAYNRSGRLLGRLVTREGLNSPWGIALAPSGFGQFSGDLLVGNFGNGRIHAYDPMTGALLGTMRTDSGHAIIIDGLWALMFGNGTTAPSTTLLFSAGPDGEAHGLFGTITTG